MKYFSLLVIFFEISCYIPAKDLPDDINQIKLGPDEKIENKTTVINTKTREVRTPETQETREQQINILKEREKAGARKLTPEEEADYDYFYKQKHYTDDKSVKK